MGKYNITVTLTADEDFTSDQLSSIDKFAGSVQRAVQANIYQLDTNIAVGITHQKVTDIAPEVLAQIDESVANSENGIVGETFDGNTVLTPEEAAAEMINDGLFSPEEEQVQREFENEEVD
jgi:hypothetical protein